MPSGGSVQAQAGSTEGWGYQIVNQSNTEWLWVTNVLASDAFLRGSADFTNFDYPVLAPGTSLAVPFSTTRGLAQFTWDSDAPIGFSNTGTFSVDAFWYDDDPYGNGQPTGFAGTLTSSYTATVVAPQTPVPEPNATLYLGASALGLLSIVWGHKRRKRAVS